MHDHVMFAPKQTLYNTHCMFSVYTHCIHIIGNKNVTMIDPPPQKKPKQRGKHNNNNKKHAKDYCRNPTNSKFGDL